MTTQTETLFVDKHERVVRALRACLDSPERCESLAGYFSDLTKDSERWRKQFPDDEDRYAEMTEETVMAEELLAALADLGSGR
jgi:hypothetical protein